MEKIDFKKIVKEKLLQELDAIKLESKGDRREMSARMKKLLKKEIDDYHKREKTRGAEMISIFSAHNFYANGFTPVELRTTLEDLGPTYVKIGQIMSSRVDLLRISNEYKKLKEAAACATVSFVCLLIYSFSCQSVTYLTDISSYHLNLVK